MLFLRQKLMLPMFRQRFVRYLSQQENKNNSQIDQKAERAKEIEYRKRMMEENQVKMMRESIQNTKGDFSPIVQYIKLFKKQLFYFTIFGFFAVSMMIAWKVVGVYEDPFSKRRKIVIVSDSFEKSLQKNLRQTFVSHFGAFQNTAKGFQQSSNFFQAAFNNLTGRDYKIIVVPAQDNIIIVFPGTIILSKKTILSNSNDDVLRVLILTQALFVRKIHLKQLAFGNLIHFLTHWIKPSNISDVNMLKIYSNQFSKQQIQQAIHQLSKHYQNPELSSDQIRNSLLKIIEKQSKNVSMFSLKTRMQAINIPQQ